MKSLYTVQKPDLPRCAEVLAKAFYDYPMYRHVLGERHNLTSVNVATRFFVNYAYHYGDVTAPSPDIEGVLCTIDSQNHRMTPWRLLRCGGLALSRLGADVRRLHEEYDRFATEIHRNIITEPHQYIICIGIDPRRQGQGLASRMLQPVLEAAAAQGYSSYLETHNLQNVGIYQRYGFELASEHQLPNSNIVMYSMLKQPTPVGFALSRSS